MDYSGKEEWAGIPAVCALTHNRRNEKRRLNYRRRFC